MFQTFEITIQALKKSFGCVFLVPGNHDLWCRRKEDPQNSLEKLEAINNCCREAGVETAPKLVHNVWIVPLLSWHHQVTTCFVVVSGLDSLQNRP